MMRFVILLFLFLFLSALTSLTHAAEQVWQGLLVQDGKGIANADVLWLRLPADLLNNKAEGSFLSRQETFQTELYAVHKLTLKSLGDHLEVRENKVVDKKTERGVAFCKMVYTLKYNPQTGYLEGTYYATDCRAVAGKVYLYKSQHALSETKEMTLSHAWASKLKDMLNEGKISPSLMEERRTNFEFKPIFFDYDKDVLRDEFKPYLKAMVEIVLSHSDLRIKVIGHTDGDGSDAYNLDLSMRRAKAIQSFFSAHGLGEHRIVIDFRGKREPVAPNDTSEGKQRNRRVDFEFI
jgi:outer membrane protein OmpA-like peptidoglycan-associated protein